MYGVVLEGGGARGAYQIGVWQALQELGIEYRGVAGTSVGALNGAMMVQGDLDQALEIWSEIRLSRILSVDEDLFDRLRRLSLSSDDASTLLQHFRNIFKDGVDTAPLRSLMGEFVDESRVRAAGQTFGFVTVSLSNWNPLKLYLEDVPAGQLIDYLLASARLLIFKKERINGKLLLDGGLYDNLPIDLLAARGFKRIIAVRLGGFSRTRWQETRDVEVTYIRPRESLGGILDFSLERARKNIKLGYFDTLKVFKGYRGRRYCLEVDQDDDYFFHLLLNIEDEQLAALSDDFGLPGGTSSRRSLLERIIPLVAELLGLNSAASYSEILIAVLERAAASSGLERFRIYSWDDFRQQVARCCQIRGARLAPISKRLPRALKGNELVLRTLREPVLDRFTEVLVSSLRR